MSEELRPGLSTLLVNKLRKEGITTREQLERMSEVDLLKRPSIGRKSVDQICLFLGRENAKTRGEIAHAKRLLEHYGYLVEKP